MSKLEQLKENLYEFAKAECPSALDDMDRIFAQEIEIPVTGEYDIDQDPKWWDINDYMEK